MASPSARPCATSWPGSGARRSRGHSPRSPTFLLPSRRPKGRNRPPALGEHRAVKLFPLALVGAILVACQASSPPSAAPKATGATRTLAVIGTMAAGAPVVGANVCPFTARALQGGGGETT